jgi:uncharacterized protein (UPF0333 family)
MTTATLTTTYATAWDAVEVGKELAKVGPAFLVTFDSGKSWSVTDRKPSFRSLTTQVFEITPEGRTLHA